MQLSLVEHCLRKANVGFVEFPVSAIFCHILIENPDKTDTPLGLLDPVYDPVFNVGFMSGAFPASPVRSVPGTLREY